MKRIIYTPVVMLIALLALSSCFTDKSSLDTNKIDEITIEAPDMPEILRVDYLGEVNFEPIVKKRGQTNPENVSYRWEITEIPGYSELSLLSNEKVLNTTIKNQILPVSYTLIFTARDEEHGIEYRKTWPLYVSSPFREGILVGYTNDGSTSDLGLIMDNNITTSYTGGSNIILDIWKNSTGSAKSALIKSLTYTLHKPTSILTKNVAVAIFADKDISMFDCENYSLYKSSDLIFPSKTPSFDPQAFYTISNAYWMLVANDKVHVFPNNQGTTSIYIPATGDNYIDNAIMIPAISGSYSPSAFWYNSNTGKIHQVTGAYATPAATSVYSTQGVFDPTSLSGRRIIAGDVAIDGFSATMLLKNESTGNYEIYSASFGYYDANWNNIPSAPKLKVDLPAALTSIINSAVSVFFNMYDPIMYVATSTKIYSVLFGGGVVSYSEKYSAPAGEQITLAKLYVQGRYRLNLADFDVEWGPIYESPLALNTKAVVVATKKGEYEGQIYVIPTGAPGTGNLDGAQAKKYAGFGKILDFTMQGQ
ncbi:MAG: PKD-like family lipoprotein [Bacteroidales bacterium]|nr:PKD-like family lipoprotein [Bacteroidales bacterium]MDD2425831.1 PKD-like family lipoprotein [Bacteroidales bacterium]MDD3990117.1 PKD-like family lipoprotein [Bacteroidales bacterium]